MSSESGTYRFGEFTSDEAELERLERQATVAWDMERRMLLEAGLKPGMWVLDLACGPGFISSRIAETIQPGGTVTGVDVNDHLMAIAEERHARGHAPNVTFHKMNVYDLDLPEGRFDFVYARLLFQHLEFPQQAFEQIKKVLRSGGRACIMDVEDALLSIFPEPPMLQDFARLAAERQRQAGGDREAGRKLGYYFKAAGFRDIAVRALVVTSEQLGMRLLLDITTGFKHELVPEAERETAMAQLEDIYEHALKPGAFAQLGALFTRASKP